MKISPHLASRLAAGVCFITLVAALVSIVLIIILESETPYENASSLADGIFWLIVTLAFPLVGGLIAIKRPGNLVGWALLLPSLDVIAGTPLFGYAELALFAKPEANLPGGVVAFVIASGSWAPLLAGVFLLFLLFPNGAIVSARWRLITKVVLFDFVLIWFFIATSPVPDPPLQNFENPLAFIRNEDYFEALGLILVPPCLLAVVAAAINLIVRFRRSTGDEREQFKWLGFAAAFLVLTLPPAIVDNWGGLATLPFSIAVLCVPLAVGIAILKYRLYDIDILINRTLVYLPLTGILAGVYVVLTTLGRSIFTDVTGAGSDASIAISTLAVVALLTPLKNQLQSLVDKKFKEGADPLANLRKLSTQARSITQVLDSDRFIETFLADLIAGLQAAGAQVEFHTGSDPRSITVGAPNGLLPVTVPLLFHGEPTGTLRLWPRAMAPKDEQATQEILTQAAGVLAEVINLVPSREASSVRLPAL